MKELISKFKKLDKTRKIVITFITISFISIFSIATFHSLSDDQQQDNIQKEKIVKEENISVFENINIALAFAVINIINGIVSQIVHSVTVAPNKSISVIDVLRKISFGCTK